MVHKIQFVFLKSAYIRMFHNTLVNLPLFIGVPASIQESEWSGIHVLWVLIVALSTILLLDFGSVVFFVFYFITSSQTSSSSIGPWYSLYFGKIYFADLKSYTCINKRIILFLPSIRNFLVHVLGIKY